MLIDIYWLQLSDSKQLLQTAYVLQQLIQNFQIEIMKKPQSTRRPFKPNASSLNQPSMLGTSFKTKGKSMIDPLANQLLILSQPEIHFVNTEINELYYIVLSVKNVSTEIQKVRIKRPTSALLSLNYNKECRIAPGLQFKITIVYDSKENESLTDKLSIATQHSEVEVPIFVQPEIGKLTFEPFLNFEFVKVGSSKQLEWEISNNSDSFTPFKLISEICDANCKINIDPCEGVIEGRKSRTIKVSVSSLVAGTVDGSIEVQPKGLAVSTAELVVNFCEFKRLMTDDKGQEIKEISLPSLFAGQKYNLTTFLQNNSPIPTEYRITKKKQTHNDQQTLVTPEQIGRDQTDKLIHYTPYQGCLGAYQSQPISISIQSKFDEEDIQSFCNYIQNGTCDHFEKEWSYLLKVNSLDQQDNLMVDVKGTSLIPKIQLSSTYLEFGQISLHKKASKVLSLSNYSPKIVTIEFTNTPNYNFTPKKINIPTNESSQIIVSFCPKKMGSLNEICCLTVGQFSFPFKTFGKGVFQKTGLGSGSFDNSKIGEEVIISENEKDQLEGEISIIGGKHKQRDTKDIMEEISKNTIHFDTYKPSVNNTMMMSSERSFFITDNTKKHKILKNSKGKEMRVDLNNFNPDQKLEPFPSLPRNQQEERTINRELSSFELKNIAVGPVVVDMGTILLRSTQTKTFSIGNFNQKVVSVHLDLTGCNDSFVQTSEQRQIVPGQGIAGFTIAFQALTEGSFKHILQYVINEHHYFEIMVKGQCIMPSLSLSKQELKFIATDEDHKFIKKQTIKLENPYNYEISYEWKSPKESLFQVEPSSGTIKPNSLATTHITHNFQSLPQINSRLEETLKLKIKHGKNMDVKCVSFVPQCTCICKQSELNLREIAVGKDEESKIVLKNISKNNTIYCVKVDVDYEDIVHVINPTGSIEGEDFREVVVRVGSTRSMDVESFLKIQIRGSKTLEIPVRANIICPEVYIEGEEIDFGCTPIEGNPATKTITLVNESSVILDLELRLPHDNFIGKSLKLGQVDSNTQIVSNKEGRTMLVHLLQLKPKCKSSWNLQFLPETTQEYDFYLPLFLRNIDPLLELQRICKCTGIKNRLIVSNKKVNFGKIIIEQIESIYSKSQVIELKNPQQEPIDWWIQSSDIAPFRIEKSKGRLEGFEKFDLKVFFNSQEPGAYLKSLSFFIDQAQIDISKYYLKLSLEAEACYPSLFFDQPYLILPTVKLGEESRTIVEIFNGGYENVNIKHTVAQEFSNVDLRVKYLSGSNLGITKKSVKVEVSFISEVPISFTLRINFYDANNRTFTLNASGTADNSIFSSQDDNAFDKQCSFLKYYLNALSFCDELSDFPKSLKEDGFQKLILLLCHYSISFEKLKIFAKKLSQFELLSEIVKTLKSEGAFLNHIRPEFLLTYEEYLEVIRTKFDDNLLANNYLRLLNKEAYAVEAKKSWVILMYQVFKVYSRVSIPKNKTSELWQKMEMKEKILVKWLEKTYQSESNLESPASNQLLISLGNCEILSSLISKYTNIKILQCYGKPPKTTKEKEKRCKLVIQTFSQIGINCLCRIEDLMRSSPKEMLLIIENLYLILPSYLQKGEPVIFNCSFGQVVSKSIEITNPSKQTISYSAKIEGCKAYLLESDSEFVIDPKKSNEVRIKYISNVNIHNKEATLTLTGKSEGKYTPSTFIFMLKGNTLGRISQKNIMVHGKLYEQMDVTVNVNNNFAQDAQFKVELQKKDQSKFQSFYLSHNSIRIRKGESSTLSLYFLPMVCEIQQCLLIFRDQKVGEFQYELAGQVENSIVCQEVLKIPQLLYTNKKYVVDVPIPIKNDLISKAKRVAEGLIDKGERMDKRNSKIKDLDRTNSSAIFDKMCPKDPLVDTFAVKLSSPSNCIYLKTDTLTLSKQSEQEPKLTFEITMKSAIKEGIFYVSLKNASGTDQRKYKVQLTSVCKPLKYELEMKTPSNKPLFQPLPLINISFEENQFNVILTTNDLSKGVLSISDDTPRIVAGQCQDEVVLHFKPKTQGTFTANLKIENSTTNQNIEYVITAISEEPEAEELIFEQQIRKEKIYNIKMPFTKSTRCTVKYFSLDGAIYNKSFISDESSVFRFKYYPKNSGKYEGKLLVEDDFGSYAFKVTVNVRNILEGELKVKTTERKETPIEFTLKPSTYTISSDCHNFQHPPSVEITEQNPTISLTYYSSLPQEKTTYVSFLSQQLGQITYLVKIIVESMPDIKLQTFKEELGRVYKEKIIFENSDKSWLNIVGRSSNENVFFCSQSCTRIPPRSKGSLEICYKPSSLELQQAKMQFISDSSIAKWTYYMSGYGVPQSKPETKQFTVQMGEQACESLTFSNPLNRPIQVTVSLENTSGDQIFTALLKNTKMELAYNQQLNIPITIIPRKMQKYEAIVKIAINDKIYWSYNLTAIAVYRSEQDNKIVKIPCRSKHEQTVEIKLPYYQISEFQTLSIDFKPSQSNIESTLKHCLRDYKIVPEPTLNKLLLSINLLSFKPMSLPLELEISTESRCKWTYKYDFVFVAPPVDDRLDIVASINHPSSLKFKLNNRIKHHAKFNAYFSADSSIDFNVQPQNGDLEPMGREGTPIEVVFCPTEYKHGWSGKLIIETQDSYWSYEVRGSLPRYNPPVGVSQLRQQRQQK